MKKTLCIILSLFCFSEWGLAQEHVGHGAPRRKRVRPQQQQQQAAPLYKRKVLRDEKAQAEYLRLVEEKGYAQDMGRLCTAPVTTIERRGTICFDRGENFEGSRYKCYVTDYSKQVSFVRSLMFDLLHNRCGGDGIHPVKVH